MSSQASAFTLPAKKRRALLDRAAKEYNESCALAVTYLAARGISEQVANQWQLGYVYEPLSGHEQYRGRLAIPYVTPTGVVNIKFRCITHVKCSDHDCKKYLEESGAQARIFGVQSITKSDSDTLYVCEGELDALAATTLAGLPAVGISGASKWRPHWQYVFEGFQDVVVLCDGDDSGRAFGDSVCSRIYNARSVVLPEGEDVNSFIVAYGAQALRDRVVSDD